MDEDFQQGFLGMQDIVQFCQNGEFEDMPLSNEVLDSFCIEPYQVPASGGLRSPNSSNPDLPASDRQSPLFPSLSPLTKGYDFQQMEDNSITHESLDWHLLHQSQESGTNSGSNTSNDRLDTNQALANASNSFSENNMRQGEPSLTGSSHNNVRVPSDGSLCVSYQIIAPSVPSESSVEHIAPNWTPTSTTHVPVAPRVVNNTSPASVPVNLPPHSPSSKAHHFVRHPSHLRHQIHPELSQYSPLTATATEDYNTSLLAPTMSPSYNFTNRQDYNTLPSYSNNQNIHHGSHKPYFRQIASAHNQDRGSPVLQNYHPFQESSLRSPVTSHSALQFWEAGQFQIPQYPDPDTVSQQQSTPPAYLDYRHISESQGDCKNSYPPAQYSMQSSNSRNVSFISQGTTDFGFNWSSPTSIKREESPTDSNQFVSTSITGSQAASQTASPKQQKKRRAKQELKHNDQNEAIVEPAALQTSDLTNLDPTDQTNVKALIDAMHNTDNVEDNQGMCKTWEKVRKIKAFRIKEVSVELLNLAKKAQQGNGTPLGEKRPINYYGSFQKRFDALHETLMFQKTVCKHLIEPPYAYGVVDDPQNARDRVKNNRRVNHQKAEAIRLGREHLGEQGQGKGRPMLKTKKRVQAQLEDSQDDDENSGDEPPSDAETDILPQMIRPKSRRLTPRAPKRTKRSSKSTQRQEHRDSVQASSSPQSQSWEDPFAQVLHQNALVAHSPNEQQWQMQSENDRTLSGVLANQQMPTLNQGYDLPSANGFGSGFNGDNSTAGSDSEGFGAIVCEHK